MGLAKKNLRVFLNLYTDEQEDGINSAAAKQFNALWFIDFKF